jgi:hypothetical protein
MTSKSRFKARVLAGHTGAAVEVPFDPSVLWGAAIRPLRKGRRGYPVMATLNGVAFESEIVPRSKRFWLLVGDDVIASAGSAIGHSVSVEVEPATRDDA